MNIWTVYYSPADYPGKFVARRWILDMPTTDVLVDDTLPALRERLPPGLYRMNRNPQDDPVIIETWI